jgi:RNA polymerase sigma-70 factor (ECF subfamily)
MFGFFRSSERENEQHWARFESEALPYAADLYRLAAWLTRNREEAEDLVQETFSQALQSFHRFESGTNCRAWLTRILYNMRGKRLRVQQRLQLLGEHEEHIAETLVYEPPTPQGLQDKQILQALAALPRQFQEVVILSDVEEFSYKEIAAALEIPIGTVMSRLARGRKLLRAQLATVANQYGIGLENEGKAKNAVS